MKNFLFIIITVRDNSICTSAVAIGLPSKNGGSGSEIICPIEKYISATRNPTDRTSLLIRSGVSLSRRASSVLVVAVDALPPFGDAP